MSSSSSFTTDLASRLISSPAYNSLCLLSNNVAARDKSVRAIQYGSRLIIGYYKTILAQESLQILQSVTLTASHARKIFRLAKSINSLKQLCTIIRKQPCDDSWDQCCQVLQGFEQLLWTFFFYYDNLLLFSRLKVIPVSVREMERKSYTCWFLADICKFSNALILFGKAWQKHSISSSYIDDNISNNGNSSSNSNNGSSNSCKEEVAGVTSSSVAVTSRELQQTSWDLLKAFFDVFVSGSFTPEMCDLTRSVLTPLGLDHYISDGHVGLCAVLSCLMNLNDQYQEIAKANQNKRAIYQRYWVISIGIGRI